MYTVTDKYGNRFKYERDPNIKELNNALHEFSIELDKYCKPFKKGEKITFLSKLSELIIYCQEPLPNYSYIEKFKIEINSNFVDLYFNFSQIRKAPHNSLIDVIPQLFMESQDGHRRFFDFLLGVKYVVNSELKKLRSKTETINNDPSFKDFFSSLNFDTVKLKMYLEALLSEEKRYNNLKKFNKSLHALVDVPSRSGQVLARIILKEFRNQNLGEHSVISAFKPDKKGNAKNESHKMTNELRECIRKVDLR